MKTIIFRRISMTAVLALFLASCGSTTGTTENNGDLVTSDVTYNEAEILGDIADAPVNNDIDYDKMFRNVETDEYEILALAAMNENLSIFSNLVELSVLDFQLEFVNEPVTVLIPTNTAFKEMPEERFEYLLDRQNKTALRKFIKRHILSTEVPLIQFNDSQIIETASEEEITISTAMSGNVVYVGGAAIVKPDIQASNGMIHILDAVVQPTSDVIAD